MFGTCIAVFDGYARSASESIRLVRLKGIEDNKVYKISICRGIGVLINVILNITLI